MKNFMLKTEKFSACVIAFSPIPALAGMSPLKGKVNTRQSAHIMISLPSPKLSLWLTTSLGIFLPTQSSHKTGMFPVVTT